MTDRRPMTPADIRRQVVLDEHDMALDGSVAVVSRRIIRRDRYRTHLVAIPLDRSSARRGTATTRPRRLTDGPVRDGWPRISPDARHVAFIRSQTDDPDAPSSLCVVSIGGGHVRRIRAGSHGSVGEVAWSPDGSRLAFTAEVDPPRFLVGPVSPIGGRRRGSVATGDDSPLARRITRADWRWDGVGHLDRWSHLFVVDAGAGAVPRQVTSGDWGVADIAWSPDGRTVAFTSARSEDADLVPRTTIWVVDIEAIGAEPREVLAPAGWANHPAWSPDGRWIVAIGLDERQPLDDLSPGLVVGAVDGSVPPRMLMPDLDRPIGQWADTDLTGWMVSARGGPFWPAADRIVATVTDRGRARPTAFDLPEGPAGPVARRTLVEGDIVAHSLAVATRGPAAGSTTWVGTVGTRAMELHATRSDRAGAAPGRPRTTFGSAWQRRHPMPVMTLTQAPGAGGPIETWIASPPDAPEGPIATVIDVHGGPLGAWAPAPHIEVILLVAAGYRVILPNIRGSASYGRDWIRPQLGDWGGVDADDVHSAIDHVIGMGLVDTARLGVLGLSYGGFMVNWLVGTSDRFAAAVSENGVTNQVSDWANSDSGPEYDRASLLGDPFSPDGIDKLWRQSPLRNVAHVHTPLLMLQGEADLRCPPQDNEQFFIALRHQRRTVEYVLYPDESHTYGNMGRPDRRIDRQTRMLAWFDRYLRK